VGRDVDINIGEEMGVLPKKLINTVMLPTMQLNNTLLFGISSRPVDRNSPMFRLMEKKWPETGKPIIKTRVFISICESCARRGMSSCSHSDEDPWASQKQSQKIKHLMSDEKNEWRREMLNEDVEDTNEPVFAYESVQALGNPKKDYGGSVNFDYVYVAIDPAAGGTRSKYAIVSFATPLVYHKKTNTYREQFVVRSSF
jgi:hypothetical protein